MTQTPDYYAVLGVLPNAEQVVITAAYRALASQYHPDRWKGDQEQATKRMAEINVAYSVLSDVNKRKEYDKARSSDHGAMGDDSEQMDQAFDSAMQELMDRWQVACSLFLDLEAIRKRLSKTSHSLAFAFVVLMLESKKFAEREKLSEKLETEFLKRYFGSSPAILDAARELIQMGRKDAIKALNKYIDVVGDGVSPQMIIDKVYADFRIEEAKADLDRKRGQELFAAQNRERIKQLKANVHRHRYHDEADELMRMLGYEVEQIGQGIFKPMKRRIYRSPNRELVKEFDAPGPYVIWVAESFC